MKKAWIWVGVAGIAGFVLGRYAFPKK